MAMAVAVLIGCWNREIRVLHHHNIIIGIISGNGARIIRVDSTNRMVAAAVVQERLASERGRSAAQQLQRLRVVQNVAVVTGQSRNGLLLLLRIVAIIVGW